MLPYSLKMAVPDDAYAIVAFFKQFPEVSFCEWQDEHFLKKVLTRTNTFCIIASKEMEIIGIILGGTIGTRGTINHLAVATNFRRLGIANELIREFIKSVSKYGVKRLFIITNITNISAVSLWKKYKFTKVKNEITLEMDI